MGTGSFPGVKRPGRGVDHPPPPSAEVKVRLRLYFYSPFGPLWPVLRWTYLKIKSLKLLQEKHWWFGEHYVHIFYNDTSKFLAHFPTKRWPLFDRNIQCRIFWISSSNTDMGKNKRKMCSIGLEWMTYCVVTGNVPCNRLAPSPVLLTPVKSDMWLACLATALGSPGDRLIRQFKLRHFSITLSVAWKLPRSGIIHGPSRQ